MCQTQGRKIEVFTAGCYLCEETMRIVKEAKCDKCELIERNISEECECGCIEKAKDHGIRVVPSIVIDGKLAIEGKPTVEQMKEALGL